MPAYITRRFCRASAAGHGQRHRERLRRHAAVMVRTKARRHKGAKGALEADLHVFGGQGCEPAPRMQIVRVLQRPPPPRSESTNLGSSPSGAGLDAETSSA